MEVRRAASTSPPWPTSSRLIWTSSSRTSAIGCKAMNPVDGPLPYDRAFTALIVAERARKGTGATTLHRSAAPYWLAAVAVRELHSERRPGVRTPGSLVIADVGHLHHPLHRGSIGFDGAPGVTALAGRMAMIGVYYSPESLTQAQYEEAGRSWRPQKLRRQSYTRASARRASWPYSRSGRRRKLTTPIPQSCSRSLKKSGSSLHDRPMLFRSFRYTPARAEGSRRCADGG